MSKTKDIAQHYVEALAAAGVQRLYAITGDSLNGINNAVRLNGKIQWIHVRHEETGAFAAGAEAQLTGQLACCAGSSGPGHVHLINGLYDAHRSYAPVLAIASACASGQFGTQFFQETNTIKLFDDCSYYNEMPSTPRQAVRQLQCAMQAAIEQEGVAVVGLPGDVDFEPAPSPIQAPMPLKSPLAPAPDTESLHQLADILNKAQKVTLYCGCGCADAHDLMLQLSQKLNAPVATTFKGKLITQADCPNYVGPTGHMGSSAGMRAMHEAEVLLILGADMPFNHAYPHDNYIIQIDKRAQHLGRRANVKMGICADTSLALKALLPLIEQKSSRAFLDDMLTEYDAVVKEFARLAAHKGINSRINPQYVAAVIDMLANDDAVFTVDTGMNDVWAARYVTARSGGKRAMLISGNHGSMANAMPQAIGAQLACPGRQVISMSGDGGISMLLGDLATIAQYKLPIKIIVFDNRALGMVKMELQTAGFPDWQTNMVNPDFARVAEACGIKGYDVTDPEQVEPTLSQALAYEGPALVSVATDANVLALPPVISKSMEKGMMRSTLELLTMGRVGEVADMVRANIDLL